MSVMDEVVAASPRAAPEPKPTTLGAAQLRILYLCCFSNSFALNSVGPYLYFMIKDFKTVGREADVALYFGLISSASIASQALMSPVWGWTSDSIRRRKPILLGSMLSAIMGYLFFGCSKSFTWAILAQIWIGSTDVSQGIISTIMGESELMSYSAAFSSMAVFSGMGGAIGALTGGGLVVPDDHVPSFLNENPLLKRYRFFLPNLVSAIFFVISFTVVLLYLDETHTMKHAPSASFKMSDSLDQLRQMLRCRRKPEVESSPEPLDESTPLLPAHDIPPDALPTTSSRHVFTLSIILVIATFGLFDFTMEGYKKLFTIYLSSSRPVGKGMDPEQLGYAFGGSILASIAIVALCFQNVERTFGPTSCYRSSLLVFCALWFITPFIGSSHLSLWIEMVVMLILRSVTSFSGITCALLLIAKLAPSKSVLGSLNGVAQGVASFSRIFSPLLSGVLWRMSANKVFPTDWPLGTYLPWNTFGLISLVTFVISCWI